MMVIMRIVITVCLSFFTQINYEYQVQIEALLLFVYHRQTLGVTMDFTIWGTAVLSC